MLKLASLVLGIYWSTILLMWELVWWLVYGKEMYLGGSGFVCGVCGGGGVLRTLFVADLRIGDRNFLG